MKEPCGDTSSGSKQLLEDLHTAHPGMVKNEKYGEELPLLARAEYRH